MHEFQSRPATYLLTLIVLAVCAHAAAYDEGAVSNGGSISGFVYFDGAPPARTPLATNATCPHAALSEDVVVVKPEAKDAGKDMNRLANAVVTISDIKTGKAFEKTAPKLDQKSCTFVPHVSVVPAGGKLIILNSDEVAHNVHTKTDLNKEINMALAPAGKASAKFDEAEIIKIWCDMHPWMKAYIYVAENPYTLATGSDGAFKMDAVPAGTYTLTVWHEKLGEKKVQVTVKAGANEAAEFIFK